MANESVAITRQAVRDVLGEYPEDVIAQLEAASRAMLWIEAILQAASRQETQGPHSAAACMIDAAKYIASDFANIADCERESMRDHLDKFDAAERELSA